MRHILLPLAILAAIVAVWYFVPAKETIAPAPAPAAKPAAPGPLAADAVRSFAPPTFKVGANEITAEVRGYMFFEGETHLALYDGTSPVDIGTRPDGLPNSVVTAEGEWMISGYVPVRQTITIPAELAGKTVLVRFVANDQRDDARPRYWETSVAVE